MAAACGRRGLTPVGDAEDRAALEGLRARAAEAGNGLPQFPVQGMAASHPDPPLPAPPPEA
eukprot:5539561-Alexandrium_andersonii.AAC.1